jgi:hypothetical protein
MARGFSGRRSEYACAARGKETLLIALENGWNEAQLHHDSKALDGLVADNFIGTDNEGAFMTKTQFLAGFRPTTELTDLSRRRLH